jgi:hypothetical protein
MCVNDIGLQVGQYFRRPRKHGDATGWLVEADDGRTLDLRLGSEFAGALDADDAHPMTALTTGPYQAEYDPLQTPDIECENAVGNV